MPTINNWVTCDIIVQAGHQNTPDGNTGGVSKWGEEIKWTPVVAETAVKILRDAGVNALKIDAGIKSKHTGYHCKLAVFVHFDDPESGESGPSVGYPPNAGNDGAAVAWKALYSQYWPFPSKWQPDNYTANLRGYYGYHYTQTEDAEFLIEFGDMQSDRQGRWMQPRLEWMGRLLAYFLSRRSGLGNVSLPEPVATDAAPPAADDAMAWPADDGAKPTGSKAFSTRPGHAYYKDGSHPDYADTKGLQGTETSYDDGSTVIEATEMIEAVRDGKHYGPLKASQCRAKQKDSTVIEQSGYNLRERILPSALLIDKHDPLGGDDVYTTVCTQFGKKDDQDGGTGSEYFGVVQTCSDVWGCSVTKSILKHWFGDTYWHNPSRLTALVEIYHPKNKRYGRVPLIDVGPGENAPSGAKIDLSFALDQYLGTQGKGNVQFRLVT